MYVHVHACFTPGMCLVRGFQSCKKVCSPVFCFSSYLPIFLSFFCISLPMSLSLHLNVYARITPIFLPHLSSLFRVLCGVWFSAAGAQILSFQSLMKRLYRSYCARLGRDPRWQRQFGILVLSAVEWPLYTHKRYWKIPDVQQFFETITHITDDKDDDLLTGPNVRYVKQIRACSFDTILRNQVREGHVMIHRR